MILDMLYDLVDDIDNKETGLVVMNEYVLVDIVAAFSSLVIFVVSKNKNLILSYDKKQFEKQ